MENVIDFIKAHWTAIVGVLGAIWTLIQEIRHQSNNKPQ